MTNDAGETWMNFTVGTRLHVTRRLSSCSQGLADTPAWSHHSQEASDRHAPCILVRRKNFLERGRGMGEKGDVEVGKEEEQQGRLDT